MLRPSILNGLTQLFHFPPEDRVTPWLLIFSPGPSLLKRHKLQVIPPEPQRAEDTRRWTLGVLTNTMVTTSPGRRAQGLSVSSELITLPKYFWFTQKALFLL